MVRPHSDPPRLDAVVFDLDGVVRHYDREHERDIELRHGLERGSLLHHAFGGELGQSFMRGEFDHDEFARRLASPLGSVAAAEEFVSMRAVVDDEAVALVRRLQERMPVALLTNGSVRTREELSDAGLHDAFDHVFNSAETGVPKPLAQAYLNVVEALGVPAARTAFIDDHDPNVAGAVDAGLVGHLYVGLDEVRRFLAGHGVPV
ncbi:MAG: HAD-IA family hydrolase [Acidimicrobiales bacterium]